MDERDLQRDEWEGDYYLTIPKVPVLRNNGSIFAGMLWRELDEHLDEVYEYEQVNLLMGYAC